MPKNSETLSEGWDISASAGARLEKSGEEWDFILECDPSEYVNAQIDDYRHLKRSDFQNKPGVRLEAEISWGTEKPLGTSGLGFWNDPFMMTGWRWPSFPVVIWFLMAGPDSDMKVGREAGTGLKAQVIDGWNLRFFLSLPLFILSLILGRFLGQDFFLRAFSKAIRLEEVELEFHPKQWQRYRIDWSDSVVECYVDDKEVLRSTLPVKGPLGLVVWQDNQWLRFDPRKGVRWGVSQPKIEQRMKVRNLSLRNLESVH